MAFKNVWKLAGGGAGWRRSSAHCGNSAAKRCATLIFANNMNSSTIEFVSRIFFACTSTGSILAFSSTSHTQENARRSSPPLNEHKLELSKSEIK
ncbi:hypothetical protein HW555_010951 [Spodoptera exigua]|uniref:Uncharacterized protein n=1 Tax=Spodoptera exigua TaxID=7107 RepID=A0A835G8J0_SPOEX|nr:hypothetical protein HW555_010951 [Spodoptera exigua]